jgi:hypothetical protein
MNKIADFFGLGWVKVVVVGIVLAGCFSAGWATNGWRLGTDIAKIKLEAATGRADATELALKKLADDSKKVNEAAVKSAATINGVNDKLDAIRKDMKNAKPPPLPAGCRPDPVRVRALTEAAAAVDAATTR